MLMQARVAKKWSQKELALKLNVKPNQYSDWENSKGVFPTGNQRANLNRLLEIVLPKAY